MQQPSSNLHITIDDPGMLDTSLSRAEAKLIPLAQGSGNGILITRKGAGRYTIEVSTSVPRGLTYQIID
ncbi:hypothetical protein [Arthrobacter sp. efr-133-R2A-120]|uniref:hypothetical protein n=1 Tax=Arthrobacter sp. efr-133-R2A-120 TaxID=3040277 RepID=UPI00254D7EFE|nr:hypothetical protein [Arthrobacter sp. efr-133-R2A-120]